MKILLYCIVALAAIVSHLALFPFADLPITVLIALLFFVGPIPAFTLAVTLGFIFDLFSPLFGVHLFLYPGIVFVAWRVYSMFLTDQSLLSFGVLSLGSFILFRIIDGVVFVIFSGDLGFLPFLHALRIYGTALLIQIVSVIIFYFIGSALTKKSISRYQQ